MKIFDRFVPRKWSARSQRSYLAQWDLEEQLEYTELMILHNGKRLSQLKESEKYQIEKIGKREGGPDLILLHTGTGIADLERHIGTYEKHRDSLRAKIDRLEHPTSPQVEERARQQALVAQLAEERLQLDKRADGALEQLRFLLKERQKLTVRMAEAGAAIELTVLPDGLDEKRFSTLLDSLPTDLATASERFIAWFLEKERDKAEFTKSGKYFTRRETLASANASKLPSGALSPEIERSGMVEEPLKAAV